MTRAEIKALPLTKQAEYWLDEFFRQHFGHGNDDRARRAITRAVNALTAAGWSPGDMQQMEDMRFWCVQVDLNLDEIAGRAQRFLESWAA